MRLTPLFAALSLLASQTAAQTTAQAGTAPSPLIGTWESMDHSPGGMGTIMVFAGDNSVLAIVSVMGDLRYTRNGNRIQLTNPEGGRIAYTVTITGDTLVQRTREKTVKMTRIPGPGPDTGLVGKWRFPYELPQQPARQGIMEYRTDGINRVRVPLQTLAGSYSVSGSELTLRFPNAPPQTAAFSIDGDTLTLHGPDRTEGRFTRAR